MKKHALLFSALLMLILAAGFADRVSLHPYVFPQLIFFPEMPEPSGKPVTTEGAALGKYLFYDPVLSRDCTMSCASCHRQQFAFSDAPNKFSRGIQGEFMKRNTMPLFNLAWYPSFFWDGRAASLESQVFVPVSAHNEMNLDWKTAAARIRSIPFYRNRFRLIYGDKEIDSLMIADAVSQFERTLISHRSKYDKVMAGKARFNDEEYAGFVLANDMTRGDCLHCHTSDGDALGTTAKFANNGLDSFSDFAAYPDQGLAAVSGKKNDAGKFRIPSIRNTGFTAPYMHDGRFRTIEEVVDFYGSGVKTGATTDSKMEFAHQGGAHFSAEEKKQLLAFLATLNDSAFVSDPEFASPFAAGKKYPR